MSALFPEWVTGTGCKYTFRDDSQGGEAVRQMSFYEIVETAQAILISYILIDGSAQAVSHIVGFISAWIKSLR